MAMAVRVPARVELVCRFSAVCCSFECLRCSSANWWTKCCKSTFNTNRRCVLSLYTSVLLKRKQLPLTPVLQCWWPDFLLRAVVSRLKWDTFFMSPTHLLQPKNRGFVGKLDDKANDAQHTSEGVFAEAEQVVAHTNVFKKADRATTVPKVLQMFQA